MRTPASKSPFPTVARGATGVIVVRVSLIAFGGGKRDNRAVTAMATSLGGQGDLIPYFFPPPGGPASAASCS